MSLITVERSSDNASESFSLGEIQDGTLLSFVTAQSATADGVVVELADVSGNGRTLTASGDQRPKIVDAGSLVTERGLAAMLHDGIDDGFVRSIPSSTALTLACRAAPTDIKGPPQIIANADGLRVSEYDDEIIAMIANGQNSSWDQPGTYPGQSPLGLAVYDGELYVANLGSDDVSRWDGSSWDTPGTYPGQNPLGLAVYDGELYAANFDSDDVSRWDGSSWETPGTYPGQGPIGLAVYDGELYVANQDSDDVSRWGSGKAVRMDRESGSMSIVAADDGSTLALHVGNVSVTASHSVSRSSDGTLQLGIARGSTQGGRFGGADEDLKGTVQSAFVWPELKSQADREDIASRI
jgi:hypothetical protein